MAHDYVERVRKMRGAEAAAKLQRDCASQWAAGNRGAKGDWR